MIFFSFLLLNKFDEHLKQEIFNICILRPSLSQVVVVVVVVVVVASVVDVGVGAHPRVPREVGVTGQRIFLDK
jgi:hypothetical protein